MSLASVSHINLYRPSGHELGNRFRLPTIAWSLLLLNAGAALITLFAWHQERGFESRVAEVVSNDERRVSGLSRSSDVLRDSGEIDKLQSHVTELQLRAAGLDAMRRLLDSQSFGARQPYSTIVSNVAKATLDGVWVTHISITGVEGLLTLKGAAVSPDLLPRYLEALGKQAAIQGRDIGSLQLETVGTNSTFVMTEQPRNPAAGPS
jgi:Tfp pilus assembly protein PilN